MSLAATLCRIVSTGLYTYVPPFRFLRNVLRRERRGLAFLAIASIIRFVSDSEANDYVRTRNYAYEGIDRISFSESRVYISRFTL